MSCCCREARVSVELSADLTEVLQRVVLGRGEGAAPTGALTRQLKDAAVQERVAEGSPQISEAATAQHH